MVMTIWLHKSDIIQLLSYLSNKYWLEFNPYLWEEKTFTKLTFNKINWNGRNYLH